jgi:hypothetical protein
MTRWQIKRKPLLSRKNDTISRQAALAAISCDITITGEENAKIVGETISGFASSIAALPSMEPGYIELTPEEAASEIACGSLMSAKSWLNIMFQIRRMGYSICRKPTRGGEERG